MDNQDPKELALMHAKLQADIGFLSDRLARAKQQANPNTVMLDTYSNMLKSKQQVLQRIESLLNLNNSAAESKRG